MKNYLIPFLTTIIFSLFSCEKIPVALVTAEDKKAAVEAAKNGDQKALFALLDKGVSIKEESNLKATLFMLALEGKHLQLASAIHEKGANVMHEDFNKSPAWLSAIHASHYSLVDKMIADGLDVNTTVNAGYFTGRTMFYQAVLKEDTKMVKILLKHKADPNIGAGMHYASDMPLDSLKYSDNKELIQLLKDAGATYSEPKED